MKENVLNYVQDQISNSASRLRGHSTSFSGQAYPQRNIYKKLESHLTAFVQGTTEQRWVVMPGLRGVGKTTVLSQLFLGLIARYDTLRILYVSLDEVVGLLNSSLNEVLEAYENILGQSFENLSDPIFVFVDEAHYDPQWGLALKSLYDRSKKVFICCTGSSAISLQTNPDILRRVVVEKLYPLSFSEYQLLKKGILPVLDVKDGIKEALYFSKTAKQVSDQLKGLETQVLQYWSRVNKLEIQQYLTQGTLPFALHFANVHQLYETINSLLDKIILKDIENLKSFDSQTLQSIKRLLFLLADANDVLSVNKLPNLVGMNSKITIQAVLDVLEQAEVLIRARPYGSQKSVLNKPSKYFFMAPVIRLALLGIVGKEATYYTRMGRLLEDAVALHLTHEFVSLGAGSLAYDPAEGGADFILRIANKKEVVIEVGLGSKEITQVKNTMNKIGCPYGLVIGDGQLTFFEDQNIVYVPWEFFLMMS